MFLAVSARFLFFNGAQRYTIEYAYGLAKWYVFNDDETSGAVFIKEGKEKKYRQVNTDAAENVLYEYLGQKDI